MDSHAQLEIRSYADVIGHEIVAKWVPLAWEAFKDYRMGGMVLSRLESDILAKISGGDNAGAVALAEEFGFLRKKKDGSLRISTERLELEQKLSVLGLQIPWA